MVARKKRSNAQPPQRELIARPLESLVFLLPLILIYEAACLLMDASSLQPVGQRLVAFHLLQIFFEMFGTSAAWLPGFAVVVILLATQLVSKQPWHVRRKAVGLMYVESVAWALPLIAVNHITRMAATRIASQAWAGKLALCIGAGVYEELIFRLVLISILVIIGADLLRFPQQSTLVAAVFISAVLFALHHHPPFGDDPFNATRFGFRTVAGVYLGGVFVFRGYGPAAGAHIAHNLLILTFAST